ncbi:DUF3857 and transglutaminase domain-containing protein [Flavobacterium sp.]|uniref:DUF3857 and transglutaminase domain-containing protein n=1 Tax=Flavobacterium sp. TaxID=239 RepID=UPI00286D93F3|nr:DUF3857 and transglutaminase domain-containing protein [Flavobacterium sp.]
MKFSTLFTALVFTFLSSISYAQKLELGKVTIEELQEKAHSKDSSAVAAILFEKGKVSFEYSQDSWFTMVTEVKVRIKIYKKEGYEWANHKVKYYNEGDGKETVNFNDAVTYNLIDGKIVKTKLKSEGEFDEKLSRYYGQKKITMPNVKEGSVIEFQYTIKSPNYGRMKDWSFQSSIPVNYSEFKTNIPEYFTYNTNQKGFIFPKITSDIVSKTISLSFKERSGGSGLYDSHVKSSVEYVTVQLSEYRTTYLAENLPAMKEESYVNNIDNYVSAVSHELISTKFPESPIKNYSTNWETVTKKIYEDDDFGPELNKTGYFEEDLKLIIASLTDRNEKIYAIFNFVKSKIKWNDFTGYSCNDGVKTAYKNKTGNVAEINLMLTAMLRYAGIEANPVLVSTRSNGIAFFPNRTAYNYVISAVEIENDLILLDATDHYSFPNVLPLRDLNWFGRLIRKDGTSSEVNLMPKTQSKEATNISVVVTKEGMVEGKIRQQFSDQLALSFRQNYVGLTNDSYLEKLEHKNGNIEITDYVRENELDLSNPVVETYSFKDSKSVEKIGDKIYISPLFFLTTTQNPFKQEKREYPIDFGFPTQNKFNISIEIPEGYAVESLPAASNVVVADNIGSFKYIIKNSGNKVQIGITMDINAPIVQTDYYEIIKEFFQNWIDKENEKIVLKKV